MSFVHVLTTDGNLVTIHSSHERVLTNDEEEAVAWIKDQGLTMIEYISAHIPNSREASIAKTKIEEAVMWAVKGLTA